MITGIVAGQMQPAIAPGSEYLVSIAVAAGRVTEDRVGFPLMVDLSAMPGVLWSASNGDDIRAETSIGGALPIDVVEFDAANRRGTVFVRTNVLTAGSEFRLRFGSGAPPLAKTAPYGRYAVWAGYEVVSTFGVDATNRAKASTVAAGTYTRLFSEVAVGPDTDCHQGVAWDGEHYYVVDTNAIKKYDARGC